LKGLAPTWPHPRSSSSGEMTQVLQRSQVAAPPITQYASRASVDGPVRAGLQVPTAPQPQTMPWNYFTMADDFP
jgi:hypothetical protein